jgi:hypothetical protein
MRRFFESKLVFAATLLAFVLAVVLSAAYGFETPAPANVVLSQLDDPTLPAFPCPTCAPPSGPGQMAQLDDPTLPAFPCPTCAPPSGPGQMAQLDDPTLPAFPCPSCTPPSGPGQTASA